MANNTILKDGNGNPFYVESIDNGSGIMRPSIAANIRVSNTDISNTNPLPVTFSSTLSLNITNTDIVSVSMANSIPSGNNFIGQIYTSNTVPHYITEAGGNPITGQTIPTGGVGITGWLSAIYSKFATTVTTALGSAFRVVLVDPTTGNASLVQAFHNTDNQSISGTSYGLFTGGVDQLLNGSGNLDRKRSVSGDAMAITGLAAEVPMIYNGSSYDRIRAVTSDGVSNTGLVQEALALFNNTTYDRARTIQGALVANTGVGVLAVEEAGRNFSNINTATTTTVKTGAGFLHNISINTPVASGTVTVYANTTAAGTKLATITLPSTITSFSPISLNYDLAFTVGLTVVTSSTSDITITYR